MGSSLHAALVSVAWIVFEEVCLNGIGIHCMDSIG